MPPRPVTKLILVVLGLLPLSAATGAENKSLPLPIAEWLVLGPRPDPLPLFGEETLGKFGADEALNLERIDSAALWPNPVAQSGTESDRAAAWSTLQADRDGLIALDAPAPAIVWLATTLDVDRFVACEITLLGAHPRRAWLDGTALASGSGNEVKGTAKLFPGTHRLLIQSVRSSSKTEPWTIGATLSKTDGALEGVRQGSRVPRRLELLDTLIMPRVTNLAIAADGKTYAAEWSRVVPGTEDSETWIEMRRVTDNALVLTLRGALAARQLEFDPTGRWWSYVTDDSAGRSTLFVSDGAQTRAVLERVEKFAGYRWLPDGRGFVYTVNDVPPPDKRGVKRVEGLLDRQAGHRTRGSLYRVTLDGQRRRLTAGSVSASLYDIAPDGSRLLFAREFDDYTTRPYIRRELWELELADYSAKKLLELHLAQSVQYDAEGKRLLLLSSPAEFNNLGLDAPPGTIANDYEGELYLWDPATEKAVCLTREFAPSVDQVAWNRVDGSLVLRAVDHDYRRLFTLDPISRKATRLDAGADLAEDWALAWRASRLVVASTGPWVPGRLGSIDLSTGKRTEFARRVGNVEFHVNRNGSSVRLQEQKRAHDRGTLLRPSGFDPSKRYPMIVNYYAGVFPVNREFGGRYPKEWWASLGYVVYVPQPSGAVGYGNQFAALHVGEWGRLVVDEVIEGTTKFLAAHPFVDPQRVGAIGASYGGFTTMSLVTKTELFAAAVSHAGISSIGGYWGQGYWGYNYNAVSAANSFPWNDRAIYADRSPLFNADKIKTPLLLTHGSVDSNVPVGESDSLFTALKLLGAPVEYLQVEGEDHWIVTLPKRVVWARSIAAWFDRWLKQQPEWWNDLYPPRS
ncbi:MAG: prolyl oligopeptidase family serine peptidase [Acidobacteriota bacterium]